MQEQLWNASTVCNYYLWRRNKDNPHSKYYASIMWCFCVFHMPPALLMLEADNRIGFCVPQLPPAQFPKLHYTYLELNCSLFQNQESMFICWLGNCNVLICKGIIWNIYSMFNGNGLKNELWLLRPNTVKWQFTLLVKKKKCSRALITELSVR